MTRTHVLAVAFAASALQLALPARQALELIIRGGEVITVGGRRTADVHVIGATIAEIGSDLPARDASTEEIDANGLLVLPGGIDPHVHLGTNRMDDYTSGSAAALAGGITTISNFIGVPSEETPVAAIGRTAERARRRSPT